MTADQHATETEANSHWTGVIFATVDASTVPQPLCLPTPTILAPTVSTNNTPV